MNTLLSLHIVKVEQIVQILSGVYTLYSCGKEYNVEKRERGKQYHLPYNTRLWGKILSKYRRKKALCNKITAKNGVGKNIKL